MTILPRSLRGAFLILATALSLTAAPALAYAPPAETLRITWSPGGSLIEFMQKYTEDRNKGTRYIVDGMCISACTTILGLIPVENVCATPYGVFAFHSATQGDTFSPVGTRLLWHVFPEHVRKMLIEKHGWDGNDPVKGEHPELIYVPATELIPACKETK